MGNFDPQYRVKYMIDWIEEKLIEMKISSIIMIFQSKYN